MSKSNLVNVNIPAYEGNFTYGRDGRKIEAITIHHVAGVISVENLGQIWQTPGREGSSHYGIGNDGRIGQYVDEENTAWCNSNWDSNCKSVTIETSNCSTGGDWPVSDEALNSLIRLVADIAKRNNLGELVKGKNLTWHSMFTNTACIPVDSELLTRNGWKKLKDIKIGDEVASADLDNLNITFEEVYDKVPIKTQDTYTCNELTVTKDHRIVYSLQSNKNKFRIDYFANLLNGNNNYYIPLAGTNNNEGLKLSDDMIRFYIAVQADGYYIKENNMYYGLEFHLKKDRKIQSIKEILDNINLDYTENYKNDGSTSIKVWNKDGINIVKDICEKELNNKCFTWNWLNMNKEQASLFLKEILFWDGCIKANKYTSTKKENLDIVNAIASINGVGSRVIGNDVLFREAPYITINGDVKRNKSGKNTEVSCVSVKTGIILIRQNGKTFIVGNCPGAYLMSKLDYIINEANKINFTKPELTYQEIDKKSIKLKINTCLWDLTFNDISKAQCVQGYNTGDVIDNIVAIATHPCGHKYYITEYSYSNHIENGFNVLDCEDLNNEPKNIQKFAIGTKVKINGNLYVNAKADQPSGYVNNKITTITRYAEGCAHPYNTTGDLGWMNECDIQEYTIITYTVQEGDTLEGIASKYGMSWQQLYAKNKFVIGNNPNIIIPGQVLTI